METSPPDPDGGAFGLVEQYDSIEDPDLRSDFLDAIGTTRSYINALRLRRDSAARRITADPEPEEVAPQAPAPNGEKGAQRPVPPLPNRARTGGPTTRPPNNTGGVSRTTRRRRNREHP
ncbi:hypothetical protein ACIOD0_06005 [Kitasatospora albolonga]|uniref:Uncharacterized protein n=1 Tax=Streptomyces stephensoniae TaxID=3375367 RepID=A0ABU2WAK3_9ACTN|nr:hypothetical protein [Streptomyces griseus]MDT0494872.1 hypothetical protein [Streptomyces griseus]